MAEKGTVGEDEIRVVGPAADDVGLEGCCTFSCLKQNEEGAVRVAAIFLH